MENTNCGECAQERAGLVLADFELKLPDQSIRRAR